VTTLAQTPAVPESPYRGIEAFRYIDQQIFPAREEETWDLLSNILIYRGVLLYGDSGSGKSSLINAGLIPAALNEKLIANRLRVQPRRGKEIKIERIPIEAEDKPPYLPSIFIEKDSDKDQALSLEISIEDFYERVKKLSDMPPGEPRPLLIFDQFEEFITLFEEALRGGETPEAKLAQKDAPKVQQAVLDVLTKLMEAEELPVKLLFVFREDYLAKLNFLFEACPELLDQYVRLLPPRVEEAEKIIRAPFVNEDLKSKFVGEAPGKSRQEIPAQLAKSIATQLQERSESGFINLSELQIVCRKIWESPDPVQFFEAKDRNIQKILEEHWADVLKKLGDLYDPAIALLSHMVTSSNTRNIVSDPDLKNHEKDNFPPERIDAALKALVGHKLVRREPRHIIYFFEIASEFLVPWIQQKKAARLADIKARKLAAETEEKLKQAVKEKRLLWVGAGVLGLFLVLAIGFAIYSFKLRNVANVALGKAEKAQRDLKDERDRSDKIIEFLGHLSSQNPKDRLQAVQALKPLIDSGLLQPEMAPVILASVVNDKDPEVASAASALLPLASQGGNKELTESIIKSAENNTELASKLPPRVYIQFSSNNQRARADQIANALKRLGVVVPPYELVESNRVPSTNQLRYYRVADGAGASSGTISADDMLRTIKASDGPDWSAVALPPSGKVRPSHFEIWFAKDPTVAPTADQKVTLTLVFTDDQGNEISVRNPRVSLEKVPFSGRPIIERSSSITAPPGDYKLDVLADGYESYKLDKITLEKDKKLTVALRPKRSSN
jgi:hypothetical protein